jgi:hypothetical protein
MRTRMRRWNSSPSALAHSHSPTEQDTHRQVMQLARARTKIIFLSPRTVEAYSARGTAEEADAYEFPSWFLACDRAIWSRPGGSFSRGFPNPPSNSMATSAGNKIHNAKLVRIPAPQRSNSGSWCRCRFYRAGCGSWHGSRLPRGAGHNRVLAFPLWVGRADYHDGVLVFMAVRKILHFCFFWILHWHFWICLGF